MDSKQPSKQKKTLAQINCPMLLTMQLLLALKPAKNSGQEGEQRTASS